MAIILVTTVASKFPSVRLRYMTLTCNEQRALLDVARCSKQNERILSSSLNMVRINQILNAILFTETCWLPTQGKLEKWRTLPWAPSHETFWVKQRWPFSGKINVPLFYCKELLNIALKKDRTICPIRDLNFCQWWFWSFMSSRRCRSWWSLNCSRHSPPSIKPGYSWRIHESPVTDNLSS